MLRKFCVVSVISVALVGCASVTPVLEEVETVSSPEVGVKAQVREGEILYREFQQRASVQVRPTEAFEFGDGFWVAKQRVEKDQLLVTREQGSERVFCLEVSFVQGRPLPPACFSARERGYLTHWFIPGSAGVRYALEKPVLYVQQQGGVKVAGTVEKRLRVERLRPTVELAYEEALVGQEGVLFSEILDGSGTARGVKLEVLGVDEVEMEYRILSKFGGSIQ